MTTWHWVRHGPTHAKSFVGWRDVPADLSATDQIGRLRAALPQKAVVISSDLTRARATADAIEAPEHHRIPHDPHLREIHFGFWDGMHFEAVEQRDPELSRAFWDTPGDLAAPGGESWNMAAARVNAAVDRISHRHQGADIIAVAHFGVILTQIQRALGVSAQEVMRHKIDNLSVTRIRWHGAQGTVEDINRVW